MTAPVFVSHSSRDLKSVRALVQDLEARGVKCWISERDIAPGDNYGDSIVDAIERASAMVLVFSSNADESDEIKKEIALASQRRIPVVPVRIEDVTPSKAFRYELATRNWIDLFPDREQGVIRLAERLASILALPLEALTPRRPTKPAATRPTVAYALGGVGALIVAAGVGWIALRPATPPAPTPAVSARIGTPEASGSPAQLPAASPSPAASPTAPASNAAKIESSETSGSTSPTPTASPSPALASAPAPLPSPTVATGVAPPTPASESAEPAVAAAPSPSASPIVVAFGPAASLSPSPSPAGAAEKPASQPVGPPPALTAGDPGGELFKECDDCPLMIVVPTGKAMLGSPPGEAGRKSDELSPHEVDIAQPLAIARHATTFDEWDACVADGGCNNRRPGDYGFGRKSRPVILVSWDDASSYVDWLKRKTGQPYRLLSEAEWEYAARGCTDLKCRYAPFWFGPIKPELAVYDTRFAYEGSPKASPALKTSASESGAPNPFGLYNMLGNVRQWVADCWSASPPASRSDGAPRLTGDCSERVTRGGSWSDQPAELRAGARSWESADERSPYIGFRVARTLAP